MDHCYTIATGCIINHSNSKIIFRYNEFTEYIAIREYMDREQNQSLWELEHQVHQETTSYKGYFIYHAKTN